MMSELRCFDPTPSPTLSNLWPGAYIITRLETGSVFRVHLGACPGIRFGNDGTAAQMGYSVRLLALIPLFFALFGCAEEAATDNPGAVKIDKEVDRGRELFLRNGCQTCHGPLGRGDGALAASLHPKPRDFRDRTTYKKGATIDQIAITIAAGVPPVMPGYTHLTGQSRRQLAKFIASLQTEAATPVRFDAANADEAVNGLRTESAWAMISRPPHQTTAAYMSLYNDSGADDVLLTVEAAVAGERIAAGVEIHLTSHAGEMMTMRRLERLAVPAAGNVQLKPGGLHLMLTDLVRPIVAGEQLHLFLRFEQSGPLTVVAEVRAP